MKRASEPVFVNARDFSDWRISARNLLANGFEPESIHWVDLRSASKGAQAGLFEAHDFASQPQIKASNEANMRVPPAFLELAKLTAANRSSKRWPLLYRMLWRIVQGQSHLLEIASDPDCIAAQEMAQAVRRDAHKMKAFVRFQKRQDAEGDLYVAWHRPLHFVVNLTADFFARRFDVMRWLILTPDDSVAWDGQKLAFGTGVSEPEAFEDGTSRGSDTFEDLWKTYYAHIFNPARIKLKAMQAQMPKHHWKTMPETELIEDMLRAAPARVEQMVRYQEGFKGARDFVPETNSLGILAGAVQNCQGCDLYRTATQAVFGVGDAHAKVMLIGEQPGDQEDLQGTPFVGPAGKLLRSVMADVGLDFESTYITNTVKHFKFKQTGARRLHVKPSSREMGACQAWLHAELNLIKPKIAVCLGATAATAMFGPAFRITQQRGQFLNSQYCERTIATYHPSALLRVPDEAQRETMSQHFRQDLALVVQTLKSLED